MADWCTRGAEERRGREGGGEELSARDSRRPFPIAGWVGPGLARNAINKGRTLKPFSAARDWCSSIIIIHLITRKIARQ
jgi:hypothetical protein